MPLIFEKNISESTKVAIWDTTEDNSFFVNALNLSIEELDFITDLRKHRLREWLSSRYLCHKILNTKTRIPIVKDEFGKPHLHNSSKFISISHSKEKAAVIISDKRVGIDIQEHVDRINIIQHKFISDQERTQIDQENLIPSYHIFWGAKECMYKAYGKKEIKFKVHMHLYPFKYRQAKLEFRGWLKKDDVTQDYLLYSDKIQDYYLVYSIHNDE